MTLKRMMTRMLQVRFGRKEGFEVVVAVTIIAIILIICVSVLFGLYMCLCAENEVKMFADPRYDERIKELEKRIAELEKKS